jgi:hypothetical protein
MTTATPTTHFQTPDLRCAGGGLGGDASPEMCACQCRCSAALLTPNCAPISRNARAVFRTSSMAWCSGWAQIVHNRPICLGMIAHVSKNSCAEPAWTCTTDSPETPGPSPIWPPLRYERSCQLIYLCPGMSRYLQHFIVCLGIPPRLSHYCPNN